MAYKNRSQCETVQRGKRGRPSKDDQAARRVEQPLARINYEEVIKHSGQIGLTRLETAERCKISYPDFVQDAVFMEWYAEAFCAHKVAIMERLFLRATRDGDMKALTYLAEHHLGRGKPETEDKRVQALQHVLNLSPEERRQRIVELTKKLAVAG
jgi:hypothetical protein